ncbi:MAG: ABC transporter ATP-binding protein, partial [Acidimicrobiales bacterium]
SLPGAVAAGRGSPAAGRALAALAAVMAVNIVQHLIIPLRGVATIRAVKEIDGWLVTRVLRAIQAPVGIDHLHDPTLLDDLALGGGNPTLLTPETPGGAAVGLVVRAGRWTGALGSGLVLAAVAPVAAVFLLGATMLVRTRAHREHLVYVNGLRPLWPLFRRANYTASLATAPGAAKETRIFGLTDWLIDRHEREWTSVTSTAITHRRPVRTWLARTQGLMTVAQAAAFAYLAHQAATGRVSLGQLTAAVSSSIALTTLSATSHEDDAVDFGMASLDAVERIEQRAVPAQAARGDQHPATDLPTRSIRFEGVSFTYRGSDRPALSGVDLELPAGRSVAIVGDNGAGKTTLVKLLARLHEPDEGRILVDGVDLRDLDPVAWRRRLAVIFQDFVRYELPARDNIGFGALDLRHDDGALAAAIHQAGATEVVGHLPAGLDTVLSRRFPGGADLSGGEWQKIALARALLAVEGGAGVLVLDEPTANLDVRAEAELFERFLELTSACTTLLVSHRFSTVRRADLICVLSRGGRVIEQGTHADLLSKGDRYAELFSLQAAKFL